jgi:hypothetical protein
MYFKIMCSHLIANSLFYLSATLNTDLNSSEQRKDAEILNWGFEFLMLNNRKKGISHRFFLHILRNKILHSVYELVNSGKNFNLFL